MKRLNQTAGTVIVLLAASVLSGCGLKEFVHANDSRYGVPGVFDTPINWPLRTYFINNFLGQYRISHQWTYKICNYSAYPIPVSKSDQWSPPDPLWRVAEVVEQGDKTLQRLDTGYLRDKSQFFRETYNTPKRVMVDGRMVDSPDEVRTQPGFRPLCGDVWMLSHNSISLSILKYDMSDHMARLSRTFPQAPWRIEQFNGLRWHVHQLPLEHVRPVPVNAIGGNYAEWLTPIGETGYFLVLRFGANQRSFENPDMHKAIEDLFMRIVQSVTIEPIEINQNQ